jgi:hypothetical protein
MEAGFRKDWLSRILTGFSPVQAGLLFFCINFLVDFILAGAFGVILPKGGKNGLISESMVWASDFLIQPVIIGYFIWFRKAPQRLVESLVTKNVISTSGDITSEFEQFPKICQSKWTELLATLISIVLVIFFALSIPISNPNYTGWVSINPIVPWIRGAFSLFAYYASLILIFDLIVFIRILKLIFNRNIIIVHPYDPDGAGRLGIIGKFVSNLCYLLGAFGFYVSISLLTNTMPNGISSIGIIYLAKVGGLIVYLLLAPVLFLLPLYSGHQAMLEWRNKWLVDIQKNIETEISLMHNSLNNSIDLRNSMEKLNSLREAYSQVESFPVWPFNNKSIKKYFGVVLSSIIPGIMSVLVNLNKIFTELDTLGKHFMK